MQHNVGAVGTSVFIIAHSILAQHKKWTMEFLQQQLQLELYRPPSNSSGAAAAVALTASSSSNTRQLRVRIPKGHGSPQSPACISGTLDLYDITEQEE